MAARRRGASSGRWPRHQRSADGRHGDEQALPHRGAGGGRLRSPSRDGASWRASPPPGPRGRRPTCPTGCSRWAWRRATPCPGRSCSGPGWPRSRSTGGGMPAVDVPVRWEVATDDRFRRRGGPGRRGGRGPVRRTAVHVDARRPRARHLVLLPLHRGRPGQPGRPHPHRPAAGPRRRPAAVPVRAAARTGRTGYWPPWAHAPAEDPDVVRPPGRLHLRGRRRHRRQRRAPAQQRRDRDAGRLPEPLRALQGRPGAAGHPRHLPVDRDLGRPRGREQLRRASRPRTAAEAPAFPARRAAAYQAWWEHSRSAWRRPPAPTCRIYRSFDWGRLARFHVLDTRQYRSDQACGDGTRARRAPSAPTRPGPCSAPPRRRGWARAWPRPGPRGTCSPTRS